MYDLSLITVCPNIDENSGVLADFSFNSDEYIEYAFKGLNLYYKDGELCFAYNGETLYDVKNNLYKECDNIVVKHYDYGDGLKNVNVTSNYLTKKLAEYAYDKFRELDIFNPNNKDFIIFVNEWAHYLYIFKTTGEFVCFICDHYASKSFSVNELFGDLTFTVDSEDGLALYSAIEDGFIKAGIFCLPFIKEQSKL